VALLGSKYVHAMRMCSRCWEYLVSIGTPKTKPKGTQRVLGSTRSICIQKHICI